MLERYPPIYPDKKRDDHRWEATNKINRKAYEAVVRKAYDGIITKAKVNSGGFIDIYDGSSIGVQESYAYISISRMN